MKWGVKKYKELSVDELYKLLQLRAEVFVVEQDCAYQDVDGKDESSLHVLAVDNNTLVAYARIVLPGVSYKEVSIGRVVVSASHRNKSLGYELMERAIGFIVNILEPQPIRISAQSHLEEFYSRLGFIFTGKAYLEDGIPHIEMLRP